jgi:outer membrane protein OmpA-like peptidoglycan-associated protein
MSMTRLPVVVVLACVLALTIGCASHKQAPNHRQPEFPGQAVVVLLPDPETGHVGKAFAATETGRTELTAARESTTVTARTAPTPATLMSQSDVRMLFGEALAALPPAQTHFTLFFRFDSEELTSESRALAPEIIRAVRERQVPDVLIVGHTDTTGARAGNFALGLRRANTVRRLLRDSGLDVAAIDVVSHGENELLVPTPDATFEARNRRVEITVR